MLNDELRRNEDAVFSMPRSVFYIHDSAFILHVCHIDEDLLVLCVLLLYDPAMSSGFNNPFRDLKKTVKIPEKPLAPSKPEPPPVKPQETSESDEEFFLVRCKMSRR